MSAIAPLVAALKYMPASAGLKLLEKFNPKFKNFFASASAYGFDASQALNYISDQFDSDAQQQYKSELEEGSRKGTLRPDEAASKSNMNNAEIPGKILRAGLGFGIGGLLAGGGDNQNAAQAGGFGGNPNPKINPNPTNPDTQTNPTMDNPSTTGGFGGNPNPQQPQPDPQGSPLSSESIGKQAQAMQQPASDMKSMLPKIVQLIQQRLEAGEDLQSTINTISNSKAFGGAIKQMETESGIPFAEWAKRYFGGQGGQGQQQPQQQGGQSGQVKEQFLQNLTQLVQGLQSLRGK